MSVIVDKLKTFEYYKKKLPLFLQNSYGFIQRYRVWFDFLVGSEFNYDNGIVSTTDRILQALSIFDVDYLEKISQLNESTNSTSDMLDKLASLFNVRRSFSLSYKYNNETRNVSITLSDKDLLILIKCQIIRQWFNGTYEDLLEQYISAGVFIVQLTDAAQIAKSDLYLFSDGTDATNYSDNVKHMFLSGLLTVDSVGIRYSYALLDINEYLVWDSLFVQNLWDTGEWGI